MSSRLPIGVATMYNAALGLSSTNSKDYDKTLTRSDSPVDTYIWKAPAGDGPAIHLSLDVVDHMLQDVMRGFGAVPKRGAEVGGILLGRTRRDDSLLIEIDD